MPSVRPTVTEARNRLAVLVRDEVKTAAGTDGVLQDAERDTLTPFVQSAAAGQATLDDVVDAVMSKATALWAQNNQSSGSGKAWLSLAEVARISAQDPGLGVLTRGALQIAATVKGTRPPLSVTLDAPAGVAMAVSGVRTLTVSLSADVPVGTAFALVVDGQRWQLERQAGGINVWDLHAPVGYGVEVTHRGMMTDPVQTVTMKITRDAETALTPELLASRAQAGLLAFVKNDRLDDADWSQYFPTTWAQAEAQVTADVAKMFADPATEQVRTKDSITYLGRGPYDLYTEVTVDKKTGKVTNALVEID
jgi:hypothetical protein